MTGKALLDRIQTEKAASVFENPYGPEEAETARRRYAGLIEGILAPGFPRNGFSGNPQGVGIIFP
jgi:hypothetical protein